MIEVSIAKLVSSVIAIILSSISIGMSISGLMSLREKRPSKKPVVDRDDYNEAGAANPRKGVKNENSKVQY